MQFRILFCVSLLFVATVLGHPYRNNDGRYYSNFKSFWGNSYGISTPYVSHGIPKIEELRKGWLDHYEYRPFFSRILFGIPPLLPAIHQPIRPAAISEDSSHEDQQENDGLTGFLDWKRLPFGPPKPMELEQEYPSDGINSDSQEFKEEIEPDNNHNGTEVQIQKGNDFNPIKNDFNSSTVAVNLDDENDDDDNSDEEKDHKKETEDERDNSDKDVDPAVTSPVELLTIPDKNSGEILLSDTDDDDDDVPQPEVMPVGPPALVPSQPTDDEFLPWHSPFDYFSHGGAGRSPSAITHKQFNEVPDPVIFANQGPIYDFWNSAEEYTWFSDDLPESPLAIPSPDDEQSPTSSPVLTIISSTTTPEPESKFSGTSDKPKSVYKPNYRKVPIDKPTSL